MASSAGARIELEATLRGHTGAVWCVAWSPLGLLASAGADRSVRIWHRAESRPEGPPTAQTNSSENSSAGTTSGWRCVACLSGNSFLRTVRSVSWGVDGRSLAAACFDSTATVLELIPPKEPDGDPRLEAAVSLEGHESEVKCVAYSSSGGLLASCSRDRSVWIWEVGLDFDYECIAVLQGHTADVKHVCWHPKAELLASASYDNDIRIWAEDEDDWFCLETLSAHGSTVWDLAFDASGRYLASAGCGGEFIVWRREDPSTMMVGDFPRYKVVCHMTDVHQGPIFSVDWSSKTGRIVTGGGDDAIRVMRRVRTEAGFAPDGANAANGASESESSRSASEDQVDSHPQQAIQGELGEAIPSASSVDVVSAESTDGSRSEAPSRAGQGPKSQAKPLRTATDETWAVEAMLDRAHSGDVNCVAWSRMDENSLASCGDDGLVRVWRVVAATTVD